MLIQALQLERFRNLTPQTFVPAGRFNVLVGDNGQGKTNLLEAIYLAGTLRSFRTQHAQETIAWGEADARVAARVERGGLDRLFELLIQPQRKHVRLDGKTPRNLGEYFGHFNVVLFAPEDLHVPRGGPAERRRFVDRSVFNRHVTFLEDAQRYARVLRTRNALLRTGVVRDELLDVYDEQLAALGRIIVEARRAYLGELRPGFQAAFRAITKTGQDADVAYAEAGPAETLGDLGAALVHSRRRDLARGRTTVGPHVDDLVWSLGGQPARAFASQGQLRALVLAWKTAEMRLLAACFGDAPVLLLDDVSSELDPSRNQFLFELLGEIACQCFITTTHARHIPGLATRQDYLVTAGEIRPVS